MQYVGMRQVVNGIIGAVLLITPVRAQTAAGFDAASVKASQMCAGGRGGGAEAPTQGRLFVRCFTAQDYIQAAYSMFADGVSQNPRRMRIFGGPAWTLTDTWDIDARAESSTPIATMYGPMLRQLLESRFHLKVHREIRNLPVYVLTTVNGARLQPTKSGSCIELDLTHMPPPSAGATRPVRCGSTSTGGNQVRMTVDSRGQTIANLAASSFYADLDRPIVDKTGLTGMFDIHLEFAREGAPAGDISLPSLFTAIQEQLGLKLTPGQSPVEVLVIDSMEKPGEN